MNGKVTVRPYRPTDQSQIAWLYARTPPAGQVAWQPQPLPADMCHIPQLYPGFLVAVEALRDGEAIVGMVGVAAATPATLDAKPPASVRAVAPIACMRHRAIAPERWRRGIGRQLVSAAFEWARVNGFRSVILNTTPQQQAAVSLYTSVGFLEAARSMVGECQLIWFLLELKARSHGQAFGG